MSEKSDKLRAMLEKEKERRIKLNNRIEILERRIQEEDSAEVNEMVRTAKVTPEQLAALLHIPGLYRLVPGVFVKSTRAFSARRRALPQKNCRPVTASGVWI